MPRSQEEKSRSLCLLYYRSISACSHAQLRRSEGRGSIKGPRGFSKCPIVGHCPGSITAVSKFLAYLWVGQNGKKTNPSIYRLPTAAWSILKLPQRKDRSINSLISSASMRIDKAKAMRENALPCTENNLQKIWSFNNSQNKANWQTSNRGEKTHLRETRTRKAATIGAEWKTLFEAEASGARVRAIHCYG